MTNNSKTLSNAAESDPPSSMMGNNLSISSPNNLDFITPSLALIQFLLPLKVLISPLCAANLNGWALSQDGKVLVEKREWTKAKWDSYSAFTKS